MTQESLYEKIIRHHERTIKLFSEFYIRQNNPLEFSEFKTSIEIFKEADQYFSPTLFITEFELYKAEFPKTYKTLLEDIVKTRIHINKLSEHFKSTGDELEDQMLLNFINCNVSIIKYLANILYPENVTPEELEPTFKLPKGQSELNREQTALFFWFAREMRMISQPTNGNLAKAIEILTGYSAKQMQDILKSPGTDAKFLGKDNNGLKREDYKGLIKSLEKLTERVKKDLRTNSENNELR